MAGKLKTLVECYNKNLYISIIGTRSVLNLAPRSILMGIFDWCTAAFTTCKPIVLDQAKDTVSWVGGY